MLPPEQWAPSNMSNLDLPIILSQDLTYTKLQPVRSMMQGHNHADVVGGVCMGLSQTRSKLPFPTEALIPPPPTVLISWLQKAHS